LVRPGRADIVAKVCRLTSFKFLEAVEVSIKKMRGGPRKPGLTQPAASVAALRWF
jgi:hypothetical protein